MAFRTSLSILGSAIISLSAAELPGGDALPHFRQAVKLDPDYLNAWKKIIELSEHLKLAADEEDNAGINLLRLDPLGRQRSYHTGKVNDLARLWKAAAEAAAKIPEKPARLLPLPASAEQLRKRTANLNFVRISRFERYLNGSERVAGKNPADVIARDQTIASVRFYLIGQDY